MNPIKRLVIYRDILRYLFVPIVFFLIISPFLKTCNATAEETATVSLSALNTQNLELKQKAAALLERLVKMRADELKKMREKALRDMNAWEQDILDLDGKGLKAALENAYAVAEGYGMDVSRLKEMYEISKRVILRYDFASLCGAGGGISDQLSNPLKDTAVLGNVVHYYGLVDKEEDRMACAMEKKVMLYKATARAFIRALTTPDPAQAAESFREYADNLRTITASDAMAATAQAEMLAAQQTLVVRCTELVPLVGDAMDVMTVSEGEDMAGNKASSFERSLILVMLITPNALEQFGKRFPDALPAIGRYLKRLTMPKGGFLDSLIIRSGQELKSVKQHATNLLAAMGETSGGKLAKGAVAAGKELTQKAAKAAADTAANIKGSMPNLVGLNNDQAEALAKSGMPKSWTDALSKTSADRGEIILIRPVNKHSKKWLESGLAVGKGKHVKGKTADWGLMAGLIPVDQSLSKLGNPARMAAEIDSLSAKLLKEGAAANADDAAKQARKIYAKKIKDYNKKVAESLGTNAKAVPLVKDGKEVVKITDPAGNIHVVYKTPDGNFLQESGKTFKPAKGARVEPVKVLADPHTDKLLAADADVLGVGSTRSPGNIRVGKTSDKAVLGNISDAETATMFEANVNARKMGSGDRMIQHGPATRFEDVPDFPITLFLPDKKGSVAIIENMEELKEVFKQARENGMNGLEPHPAWGWKEGWDK